MVAAGAVVVGTDVAAPAGLGQTLGAVAWGGAVAAGVVPYGDAP